MILNRTILLQRVDGSSELLSMVAAQLLEDLPPCVADLEASLRAGALGEAQLQAHRLKGTSATVGAERLEQTAAHVEQLVKGDALPDPHSLCTLLDQSLAELLTELEALLTQHDTPVDTQCEQDSPST